MKTAILLKYLRRILAVVFGGMLLLFFLDFTRLVPAWFHELAQVQFVPALMNGLIGLVALWIVLTLILGRVYCSVICPLGIMQDVILRVKKWFYRARKQKKKLRTAYERPHNIVRYSLLGLGAVGLLTGWTALVLWLDPYSNFGRVAVAAFKPVVAGINNGLASLLARMGKYSLYHYEILSLTTFAAVFGIALLAVIVVLVWRRERIWCNTICPVGTLLGFVSRFSLFRVTIDPAKCNHCKNCSADCKSRCIDEANFRVDTSRCVVCFDCLGKCNRGGINYRPSGWSLKKHTSKPVPATKAKPTQNTFEASRRQFIKGSAITLAALPMAAFAATEAPAYEKRSRYPLPPGAAPDFAKKCTGCQLCVTQCPMQVLRPAFMEHGMLSMMQPLLYFHPGVYCNYDCVVCGEVCPTGAIKPLTVEDKRLRQMGEVHFIEDECIVKSEDQDCGACAEHCPTQAVRMVPYHNGLTIPQINPAICVGCGACESICPVRPLAIFVEGWKAPDQRVIDAALLKASDAGTELDLDAIFDNALGGGAGEAAAEVAADTVKAAPEIDFGF